MSYSVLFISLGGIFKYVVHSASTTIFILLIFHTLTITL